MGGIKTYLGQLYSKKMKPCSVLVIELVVHESPICPFCPKGLQQLREIMFHRSRWKGQNQAMSKSGKPLQVAGSVVHTIPETRKTGSRIVTASSTLRKKRVENRWPRSARQHQTTTLLVSSTAVIKKIYTKGTLLSTQTIFFLQNCNN